MKYIDDFEIGDKVCIMYPDNNVLKISELYYDKDGKQVLAYFSNDQFKGFRGRYIATEFLVDPNDRIIFEEATKGE